MPKLTSVPISVVPVTRLNGEFPIIQDFVGVTPQVITRKVTGTYIEVQHLDTIIYNQQVYLAWNVSSSSYIKADGVTVLRAQTLDHNIDQAYSVFHSVFKQRGKIRWSTVKNPYHTAGGAPYFYVTTLALLSDLDYLFVDLSLGEIVKIKKAHELVLLAQKQLNTLTSLEGSIAHNSKSM
jgi:hypothetical protein